MKSKSKKKPRRRRTPKEDDLLTQVIRMTGIPARLVRRELKTILDRKNIDANQLTLEQLRAVVACYVRQIMVGLLEKQNSRPDSK